ncbi:M20 peptidase aminoacylase family protein [Bacillus testis]|uniref:M20 peptidase aminoacylase family protein n=1 Tax=Bacillus testis TaxID=1622072 RepID=UPI00067E84A0|nr:M20 peptidase aminoacylase family protein [Bacillus testis]
MIPLNKQEIKEIKQHFLHLHTHPEISWKEIETTRYLYRIAANLGCSVRTFDGCTGLIAEIGTGKPVVAVRSDIDALWQEVDGKYQAHHSCGHDAHMAIVLGSMIKLQKQAKIQGTIRFIFQPAEEKGAGALAMIKKGAMDGVDYLFGVHLRPDSETPDGRAAPAILNGASTTFEGTILGEEAHAARPHLGINSIEVAAALVNRLAFIHLDPMVPYSVKMTSIQAGGESSNIIPAKTVFSLDVRAQTNDTMDELRKHIHAVCKAVGQSFGATIQLTEGHCIPATSYNEEAAAIMKEAIVAVLGADYASPPIVSPGGEDFHFYSKAFPEMKATMLGLGCGLKPGLHHPDMSFNEDAIITGVDIMAEAVWRVVGKMQVKNTNGGGSLFL